jgi:hypothetical protein
VGLAGAEKDTTMTNTTKPKKPVRGGAREGAGRKTDFVGKAKRTLTLSDECVRLAKLIGDGNASEGIEIAVRAHVVIALNDKKS